MKRFRVFTVAALVAGLLAGGAAYAQGPGAGGRGRGPGGFGPGFGPGGGLPLRALNLTDAQREQVRTLTQQYREQNRTAAERLRAAFEAQRRAVETVPVNEQLIRSTTQELADAQAEVAIQRARMHSEVFALLTPEQQAEAKKLQAEREARRERMRQQRPPRGPQQPGR
jgi:Spy/CpxP family protein refolding chaperone